MYEKPNKMINMYGGNIYAFVTYLNYNNLYTLPQLLVLAFSLMRCGSHTDRVCIVSTDVDISYVEILRKFYKIYQIPDVIINGESFMKYYSLTMTQYKKILLINPNFLILQYPDFLFKMQSPAGYFKHGKLNVDLLLLTPELNVFDSMIFDMRQSLIKIDQTDYIYNKYYVYHWSHIGPEYFYLNQKIYNIDKVMYIYYTTSPTSIIMADMNQDDIYITWFNIYKQMLEHNPDLIISPLLSDTNRTLAMIMKTINLSRESEAKTDTDIAGIKNLYGSGEIHMNLAKYYHLDTQNDSILDIEILFDDIEEYNYIQPIKKLYELFKNPYLKTLSEYTTSEMKGLHIYNYMDINDRDYIMMMYMRCFKNIKIEILKGDIHTNELKIDELKLKGVYYIKTLFLSKKEYENLLFMTNYKLNFKNRIEKIDTMNLPEENEITFVFVKDKNDNYELQIRLCDLILNQNNLHRLKHQNIHNISSDFFGKSNLYINTLRNWIESNLSAIEKERLILFGDIVLNSFGIKAIEKIEGIFISIDDDSSEREKNLEEQINTAFNNIDTKFYFTHITKEKSNNTSHNTSHKKLLDKIKEKAGVENSCDLITNPKFYYNYKGLKLLSNELNALWLENQSELKKNTDIVMSNIINKNVLSRHIHLDKKNRITEKKLQKIKEYAKKNYIKKYVNEL
jgi:hypothetical protein